ncbi:hypothetical protein GCM10007158_19170 [Vreelandella hamiltonii]|uniref:Uncharacterized protein n=2 Tax=Halomonadaceae TaxID=28256 RepID=A0A8H9I5W2_9GAMM|nr:hypothetical protein GCM10007157_11490 [Halomonas hamiltonii]GGW58334.1 hypothetical protein GCM10007158_19170 [Halomonas johnsoniae]
MLAITAIFMAMLPLIFLTMLTPALAHLLLLVAAGTMGGGMRRLSTRQAVPAQRAKEHGKRKWFHDGLPEVLLPEEATSV